MTLMMPVAEEAILSKRAEIVARLEAIVRPGNVLSDERQMRPYECDAVTMYRQLPLVVVLPETVAEVSQIMALAKDMNVKVVPRGGGTSLSGGSLPLEDGILLAMGKFNKILEVDYENRCAVVQPGVANLAITRCVEGEGFYYAPGPVLADRLFDRRQCRREFRRHSLPEIRAHHQQHPRTGNRADGR